MTDRETMLENSLIVGAHPDDELLWFNAIMKDVDRIVIVYRDFWAHPDLGAARGAAIADLPHPDVTCLELEEAGTYGCADWSNPEPDEIGIAFSRAAGLREVKRRIKQAVATLTPANPAYAPQSVTSAYRENYQRTMEALRPHLAPGMNVFSHNPWGEYGHEDHIQVFRVLEHLRDEIGFTLWMSNYCTERALPLASRYFQTAPGGYVRLKSDTAYADKVADVYRLHGCWTWADDWAWFEEECYMPAPSAHRDPSPQRHLMPLNMFTINEPPKRRTPATTNAPAAFPAAEPVPQK